MFAKGEPMKIAMFTNNYKPFIGGVPVSVERLAKGLRDLGHTVDVFAPSYEGQIEEEHVFRFKSRKKNMKGGFIVPKMLDKDIRTCFAEGGYQIIHSHHPMVMGHIALYLARKHDVPLVYTYHTRYDEYLHYLMPRVLKKDQENKLIYSSCKQIIFTHTKFFANKCQLIFAPTPEIKSCLQNFDIDTSIDVLPTGLTDEDFISDPNKVNKIQNEFDTPHLFCSVSRLEVEKNFPFLLRGLAELKKIWHEPFKVMIIGDGTEKENLERLAKSLGLSDEVSFLGRIPHAELVNYYAASKLFLFSSQSETQGIVMLEAMASSLPVVAVEGSGVNDVVRSGENGFITALDEKEWSQSIKTIMEDDSLYQAMHKEALLSAKSYTAEAIALQAEKAYLTLLEEVSRRVPLQYKTN